MTRVSLMFRFIILAASSLLIALFSAPLAAQQSVAVTLNIFKPGGVGDVEPFHFDGIYVLGNDRVFDDRFEQP